MLLAPLRLGLPALFATLLLLMVNVVIVLFCLFAAPLDAFAARLPRVGARVRASPLAQRTLAGSLALLLPFHSGGAVVGPLAGRMLGLSWRRTLATVVGVIAVRFGIVLLAVYGFAWGMLR